MAQEQPRLAFSAALPQETLPSQRLPTLPMTDFAAARRMMVDNQVRTSDVTDMRVLAAMLAVPRERFLPPSNAALAYLDLDVPVTVGDGGNQRRMLTPMVLAKLLQAAEIGPADRVLDVGAATGYS